MDGTGWESWDIARCWDDGEGEGREGFCGLWRDLGMGDGGWMMDDGIQGLTLPWWMDGVLWG